MNDRIRRDGTRALAAAARNVGARRLLFQSIVWVARPADQSAFDETSPAVPHPPFQSATGGEQIVRDSVSEFTILRCGSFHCGDAGHTPAIAEMIRERMMPVVGKGDAVWAMPLRTTPRRPSTQRHHPREPGRGTSRAKMRWNT